MGIEHRSDKGQIGKMLRPDRNRINWAGADPELWEVKKGWDRVSELKTGGRYEFRASEMVSYTNAFGANLLVALDIMEDFHDTETLILELGERVAFAMNIEYLDTAMNDLE